MIDLFNEVHTRNTWIYRVTYLLYEGQLGFGVWKRPPKASVVITFGDCSKVKAVYKVLVGIATFILSSIFVVLFEQQV